MNYRALAAGAFALGGLTIPVASMPRWTTPRTRIQSRATLAACTPVGNATRVITDCTIVIDAGKQDDKAARAAAYFNRGSAYMTRGDNDRAIADLSASMKLDASQSKVFNNRAFAYEAKGDTLRAIADFGQSLRLTPDDPAALLGRGREYATLNDGHKALADFDRAITVAPNFPFAYISRAYILFKQGDLDRARADIARYRHLMPGDPEGAKAEAALQAATGLHKQ